MEEKKVKNKLKQLKYQHLKKIYSKKLSITPENCKYNKEIRLPNRSKLNVCGFNFEETYEVDLCYKSEHASDCNAFCVRKTKEELGTQFNADVKDEQIRATLFKDINTIYWLYPDLVLEDFPEKTRWYHAILKLFRINT